MEQLNSIIKKSKTMLKNGITPIKEGKKNYEIPLLAVEKLALDRMNVCVSCKYYKKEPIDFLQVVDERIPQLNRMYCEKCGCELPYKLRQTINKCKKWQQ